MSDVSRARPQPRSDAAAILGTAVLLVLIFVVLGLWAYANTRPETAAAVPVRRWQRVQWQ